MIYEFMFNVVDGTKVSIFIVYTQGYNIATICILKIVILFASTLFTGQRLIKENIFLKPFIIKILNNLNVRENMKLNPTWSKSIFIIYANLSFLI